MLSSKSTTFFITDKGLKNEEGSFGWVIATDTNILWEGQEYVQGNKELTESLKIKVANGKTKIKASSTVLSHNHFYKDPCLGKGKCAMRRIQLYAPQVNGVCPNEQPRYANVEESVYHSVLGDYIKWIIMDFNRDHKTDEESFEEINKILDAVSQQGLTCILTSLYWKDNKIKCDIAIGKGKKTYDQREDVKKRDWNREKQRILKNSNR